MSTELDHNADDTAPRWQRRPEDRPTEILDAALLLFSEQGFARTKLEEVAKKAGVSKGTVYLYFESKDALFQAIVRKYVTEALLQLREIVRQHTGTSESLLRHVMELIWTSMRNEGKARLSRLVHSELANFPDLARFYFAEVVIPSREMVSEILTRGIQNGEFAPVNPDLVGRTICVTLLQWASNQRYLKQFDSMHFSDDEVFAGVSDLLLRGLKTGAVRAQRD